MLDAEQLSAIAVLAEALDGLAEIGLDVRDGLIGIGEDDGDVFTVKGELVYDDACWRFRLRSDANENLPAAAVEADPAESYAAIDRSHARGVSNEPPEPGKAGDSPDGGRGGAARRGVRPVMICPSSRRRTTHVAANSAIEWTGRTWQVTCGCLHKSSGCAHCYAETMANRIKGMALADIAEGRDPGRKRHYIDVIGDDGRWNGRVVPVPEALPDPLSWRKPQTVFVDSMSDLFFGDDEDERRYGAGDIPFAPVPFKFNAAVFGAMALTRRHTYQVLTKRAGRLLGFFREAAEFSHPAAWCVGRWSEHCGTAIGGHDPAQLDGWPLPNVWIGCSAEDQKQAIKRHRSLVNVPAAVRFWSIEPLLGPIEALPLKGIGWVIVGGESGHGARPCAATWVRDIVRQCQDAGVPVFVKQIGSNAEEGYGVNRKLLLEHSKGGDPDEWPEDLRIREMPKVSA